jgi:predicted oxidoreductase
LISSLKALKDIPRNAYYIGTKVGRYETDPTKMFDFSREKTLWSVDHSLQLLGLDYVDIIQVNPYFHSATTTKTFTAFYCVRFEAFTTVTMKNGIFWDVFLRSVCQLLVTANAVPSSPILVTLIMDAILLSETLAFTRATQCNIPEDAILHSFILFHNLCIMKL